MESPHTLLASPASLMRRMLSLGYEVLMLCAVLVLAAAPIAVLSRGVDHLIARPLLQLYLMIVAGAYFVFQWGRGGQTLPMKTWHLRLVRRDGGRMGRRQAVQRYCLALAGTLALGAGFVWALIDRDRQFLHDRFTGTVIVKDEDGRRKAKGKPDR